MSFAGQDVHICHGEGSVWRPQCSCSVSMQTVGCLAGRLFLPSVAS